MYHKVVKNCCFLCRICLTGLSSNFLEEEGCDEMNSELSKEKLPSSWFINNHLRNVGVLFNVVWGSKTSLLNQLGLGFGFPFLTLFGLQSKVAKELDQGSNLSRFPGCFYVSFGTSFKNDNCSLFYHLWPLFMTKDDIIKKENSFLLFFLCL